MGGVFFNYYYFCLFFFTFLYSFLATALAAANGLLDTTAADET